MIRARIGGASRNRSVPRRLVPLSAHLLGVVAATTVLAAVPGSAFACSCFQLTAEQAIRSTPVILMGRPMEVRRSRPPDVGFDLVTATIEVSERWKGEASDKVLIHGHTASSMCGYAHFPLGEPQLFLASPRREGDGLSVNACGMAQPGRPGSQVHAAFAAALAQYRTERERLDGAIAAAPGSPKPLLDKGLFLEEWEEWQDAAATYKETARLVPDLPAAHLGQGRALFNTRRFDAARAPLQRALALNPPDREAARLLGQARFHLGDLPVLESLDFRSLVARELDVSGRDLRGRDFSAARIERARFDGADLRQARFTGARIGGSMARADLSGARMNRASVSRMDFSGAKLDGADLSEALVNDADFRGASLRKLVAPGAAFAGASLAGADLRRAGLPGSKFYRGQLAATDFADARLVGAEFDRADLRGADLSRADLRGASFDGAKYDCRTRFPRGFAPERMSMEFDGGACRGAER